MNPISHKITIKSEDSIHRALRICTLMKLSSVQDVDKLVVECKNNNDYYDLMKAFNQFKIECHLIKHFIN